MPVFVASSAAGRLRQPFELESHLDFENISDAFAQGQTARKSPLSVCEVPEVLGKQQENCRAEASATSGVEPVDQICFFDAA